MKILVVNCGGATFKYKFFEMPDERLVSKGSVDRLGTKDSVLEHEDAGKDKVVVEKEIKDHEAALKEVFNYIDPKDIAAVSHKIAHGGPRYIGAFRVDAEVTKGLDEGTPWAPLHNPPMLNGIRVCEKLLPGVPQTISLETGFHRTVPEYAWAYGLPREWYDKYGVRKYGFHGASHRFISERVAELLKRRDLKLVSPSLMRSLVRLDAFVSIFRGSRQITSEHVRAAFGEVHFSSDKIKEALQMEFTPLEQVIEEVAGHYRKDHP